MPRNERSEGGQRENRIARELGWVAGENGTGKTRIPRALTIAGSDSGGGAGIQADLKTFTALGVFGMSAITAITAQNTREVRGVHVIPPEMVRSQILAVAEDIGVDAAKTGMLANEDVTVAVAKALREAGITNLVVDPVMISKSGYSLLPAQAQKAVIRQVFPLARIVTPNIPEAQAITGMTITSLKEMKEAARRILEMGPGWVVLKGGHLSGEAVDVVSSGDRTLEIVSPRIETKNTHGTGCTFSAAICAYLAKGMEPLEAIKSAKKFITWAIMNSLPLGNGYGPTNHFYFAREGDVEVTVREV